MSEKLHVAFRLFGGIGTYLMEENFIQCLYEKYSDVLNITIYAENSDAINDGILRGQHFVYQYFQRCLFHTDGYDLVIDINWFPKVVSINKKKIERVSPQFAHLVQKWIDFEKNPATKHFFETSSSRFDPNIYMYAVANKKTRLTIADIDGSLNIERAYRLKLKVHKDEEKVLARFGLTKGEYITMQQGVNAKCRTDASPRQWPNQHYSKLCKICKEAWPGMKLVQLGELGNNTPIEGVDLCLLGQTDFEDLKVVLKNAVLHIDGDCGMVHLRKALHGGSSVVLFGQTSREVLGYDDDINLVSGACKHWCGKVFDAWKRKCYIADHPVCMEAITPEMVMENINHFLDGTYKNDPVLSLREKLLADTNIALDEEWVDSWLSKREIYAYWLEKVKISELVGLKLTENGYVRVPITEMPAYKYFSGDKQSYVDYMQLNDTYNPGHEHSIERFEALIDSFKEGVNLKCYVAVDGTNRILDGAHRASWFAYQQGIESEITVLKLYTDRKI